jgi:hypothetical protein
MQLKRSRRYTLLRWITGYLWTVPVAVFLSRTFNWQYDGDLGWWIVAAYTAPIQFLAEPFQGIPKYIFTVAYGVFLLTLTVIVVRATKLNHDTMNDS